MLTFEQFYYFKTASKPIPVVILGILIAKKSYTIKKYFFVLAIVVCVGVFVYDDKKQSGSNEWTGLSLLAVSLLSDGLMAAYQDKMRSVAKPSSLHFMLYVNVWSSGLLIFLLAGSGEGRDLFEFCLRFPNVIWKMAICILLGIAGNFCISSMVVNFGSLPLSLVTTSRKIFSVFVSAIAFNKILTLQQWIATAALFVVLMLDSYFSKRKPTTKREVKQAEPIESESTKLNFCNE